MENALFRGMVKEVKDKMLVCGDRSVYVLVQVEGIELDHLEQCQLRSGDWVNIIKTGGEENVVQAV